MSENAARVTERVLSRSEEKGRLLMKALLTISRAIDAVNERVGRVLLWLVLIMVLVSAGNAISRYLFSLSSNAWLELQWYLFSAVFLGCAGYTLLHNEHIRIDVVSTRLPRRVQVVIDIFGILLFLFPMATIIMWMSWPVFLNAYNTHEVSVNAGGLLRWPARLLVPVGFFLLLLQGVSELIKRIAFLMGRIPDPAEKHVDAAAEAAIEQLKADKAEAN
jgi:TRAP-type mannitol/chloroaromatic compound transport system permease small subunit